MKQYNKIKLLAVALMIAQNAGAQLTTGSRGLTIKAGTTFTADSLVLVPTTDQTLTNNTLTTVYSAAPGMGAASILRDYVFSSPLYGYTGSAGMYFSNAELNGNRSSWLAVAYSGDTTRWKTARNGGATAGFVGSLAAAIPGDSILHFTAVNSSDFYSKNSGNVTVAGTWGENADGSGTAPADFTNPYNNFVLTNRTSVLLPNDWQLISELDVDAGTDLNVGTHTLTVNNLNTNGTLSGSASSALVIKGNTNDLLFNQSTNAWGNIIIDSTANAAIGDTAKLAAGAAAGVISVRGNGVLNTNGRLMLLSDSLGTARIGYTTGTINGDVKCMQYIRGGRRAYRFWSHPFSNNINLSQIQNYIDITGPGGATNGFTSTASNSPSAYWYHTTVGNSAMASDPGWKAFNTCNAVADTDKLQRYEGMRLYIRGVKGQGFGYAPEIPSPVTIGMWGQVNTGNQSIQLAKGVDTTKDYNLIGNPYASPVDIGTVIAEARDAGKIRGAAFYIWNPYRGTAGGFEPKTIGSSYILQAYNAFQVRAAYNGATLEFTENNKRATAAQVLLKTEDQFTTLQIYDADYHPWDITYINFDDEATAREDMMADAGKLSNFDCNFYSLSADEHRLSIDSRPFVHGKSIPLGFTSNFAQTYILRADNVAVPTNGKLYLYDKYLDKKVELTTGTEYKFDVTEAEGTQGNARFELQTLDEVKTAESPIALTISPNPATDEITASFIADGSDNAQIRILDIAGVCVTTRDMGNRQNGVVKLRLDKMTPGMYMLEFTSGGNRIVQRFLKQ